MKKFILKLDLHDAKDKRKALKTVSTHTGIDSISMDMKEKKLTLIGTVDPISVVSKLRKFWTTDIISVGPAVEPKKEEPKKEEPKKEEPKKEEAKKEEPKKEEGKEEAKKEEPKKEEGKKEEPKKDEGKKEEGAQAPAETKKVEPEAVVGMIMPYHRPSYYPPMNMSTFYHQYQPHHHSIEENPNACVIS